MTWRKSFSGEEIAKFRSPADAAKIREIYKEVFIDTERDDFGWRVRDLVQFSDGMFQRGYMWECLKS